MADSLLKDAVLTESIHASVFFLCDLYTYFKTTNYLLFIVFLDINQPEKERKYEVRYQYSH